LRHYSYLNAGLKLLYNGNVFQSRNGLLDLIMEDLQADGSEPSTRPCIIPTRPSSSASPIATARYGETFYSFVNGQYTSDGGTHLSAFREGLLKPSMSTGARSSKATMFARAWLARFPYA